jgi:uncharacterized membrane protein
MAQHSASVTVDAPVHQVYALYSHFNDYPKFMTFVKEVTYLDDQRSHWVVDVAGKHEWDAINEDWVPDRQVGWRSLDGVTNRGRVLFEPAGSGGTRVIVDISYEPPAGIIGRLGELLGAGGQFERRLQHDLRHFAQMVAQAPPGALDPTSSAYLFHDDSAAAKGTTTREQDESMGMRGDAAVATPAENLPTTTSVLDDPTLPRVPGTRAS